MFASNYLEHRARMVDRLRLGRDPERAHSQVLRDTLARFDRAWHSFDGGPGAFETPRRQLRFDDRLQGMKGAERCAGGDERAERLLSLNPG